MSSPLEADGPFGRFAERLLMLELPGLPADRRRETLGFVCRRAAATPGPLRLGVIALAVGTAGAGRLFGDEPVVGFMRSTPLPLVGELARMVRSLGFAYVWETWPDSGPDGAPSAVGREGGSH